MSLNLRSHKCKIVVFNPFEEIGLEVTRALLFFTGSDSKVDTSGIVSFTGQIELGELYRDSLGESLDDRLNSRWERGNRVIIDITNASGVLVRHPRGALRILQSQYSPVTRRLTLSVGDILALNDFREEEDDKSGVVIGTNTSRNGIINRLLAAAGCSSAFGGPADFIPYPIPKFEGSYIQQAGQLAFAAGYFLWVNKNEQIRCDRIDLKPDTVLYTYTLTKDVARYERLQGSEKPCAHVRCLSTTQIIKTPKNPLTTTEEFYTTKGALFPELYPGSTATILQSRITTTITAALHTETTVAIHEGPFSSTVISGSGRITGSVSTAINIVRWKTETTKKSYDLKGRLSSVEFTDARPPGYWVTEAHLGTNKNPITGIKNIISYTYNSKDILSRIDRTQYKLASTILNGFVRTNHEDTAGVAFKLVLDKKIIEEWVELRENTWKYSVTEQINNITEEKVDGINLIVTSSESHISNNGQTTPPATEYYQSKQDIESKQLIGEARFNVGNSPNTAPRRRDYNIPYATSNAQLTSAAHKLGGFLFGRDKGQQIDVELSDRLLSDYQPLARHDVYEGGTTTQSLLLDGCSWALNQTTAKLSSDSIWIGTIEARAIAAVNSDTNEITSPSHGFVANQPVAILGAHASLSQSLQEFYVTPTSADSYTISVTPGGVAISLPDEAPSLVVIPQNSNAMREPYSTTTVMEGGISIGGKLEHYPYSLLPSFSSMRGGIRVGGELKSISVTTMRGGIRIDGNMVESVVDLTTTFMRGGIRVGGELKSIVEPISDPIAHYKFNEGSGQTLIDYSGNNRNGTLGSTSGLDVSDPVWTSGGLSFDGIDDFIQVPDLLSGSGSFTIAAVTEVNTAISSNRRIYAQGGGSTSTGCLWGYEKSANKMQLAFWANDVLFVAPGSGIRLFTVTYNSQTLKAHYYENEVFISESTFGSGRNTNAFQPRIGSLAANGLGEYWAKPINYFIAYNRVLSATEVAQNYRAIKAVMQERGVII